MSYDGGPGIWIARNRERQQHSSEVGALKQRIRRLEAQIRELGARAGRVGYLAGLGLLSSVLEALQLA